MKPYYEHKGITIYHGDCLEVMPEIRVLVDMIMTDPPYEATACKWDKIIPIKPMWGGLKRLTKKGGVIALTATQPFASKLIMSNLNLFRYDIIWDKMRITGHLNAAKMPLRRHETILIFYDKLPTYNLQKTMGKKNHKTKGSSKKGNIYGSERREDRSEILGCFKYPTSIIEFEKIASSLVYHPTQKPLSLVEYLINTYTNNNEMVLDFAMGSGTTLVAAKDLGRKAIGIEIEEKYCEIAARRLQQEVMFGI